jgi:hypothetical protein
LPFIIKKVFFAMNAVVGLEIDFVVFFDKQLLVHTPSFGSPFFWLAANDRGYGHLAVCGSIRCRETTK